jgi:hypothetical protein
MVRENVEYSEKYKVNRKELMKLMIKIKKKKMVMEEGEELK